MRWPAPLLLLRGWFRHERRRRLLGPISVTSNFNTSGSLSNSQCKIDFGHASATGTDLNFNIWVTFAPGFAGTKQVYADAQNQAGLNSGWQFVGTWNTALNRPRVGTLNPNSGTKPVQTFTASYASYSGVADIAAASLFINDQLNDGSHACWSYYVRATNTLYLVNDAGTGFVPGAIYPGVVPGSLSNSQCTISEAGPVSTGTTGFTLPVRVAFTPAFAGSKLIFGGAQSNENLSSPWTLLGNFNTYDPAARAPSVTPYNGAGSPQVFTLEFQGLSLTTMNLLFHAAVNPQPTTSPSSTANACWILYDRASDTLSLANDAGSGFLTGFHPGGGGSVSNSQCTISDAGASTITYDIDINVPVRVTFAPGFAGYHVVFTSAQTSRGEDTGWVNKGTWQSP